MASELRGGHENCSRTEPARISSDRSFGYVFASFFLIITLWPLLAGKSPRGWYLIISAAFLLMTVTRPSLLAPLNRVWARFGLLLHRITSPVVLGILFLQVV